MFKRFSNLRQRLCYAYKPNVVWHVSDYLGVIAVDEFCIINYSDELQQAGIQ